MRILLGGATGFIGKHLTKRLQLRGHEVIIVSRSPGSDRSHRITWDNLSSNGLPEKCDAVVNLAGENILNPLRRWNAQFISDLESSRIGTTRIMAEAIVSAQVKPAVFVTSSAIGYYEPSETAVYNEYSASGSDYLSQLCKDWEAAARLPEDYTGVRQATIRIGVVLGREGGIIQNMYLPFYFGLGGRIGSGQQWFPWIHINDIVGIYTYIIETDSASGIFNGVSPNCITNSQFTNAFAAAMRRPALFPAPGFMINCVFGQERGKIMLEGHKVIPQRIIESGYKFLHPDIEDALIECIK